MLGASISYRAQSLAIAIGTVVAYVVGMNDDTKTIEITVRPIRLTNEQYGELKRLAQIAELPVNRYVELLIKATLTQ